MVKGAVAISRKTVKIISQTVTILLWVLSLYLMLGMDFWLLFGFILALHVLEVFLQGYKKGIKAGYSGIYSVIMTLIFGFTWWLYLDDENED